MMILRPIGDFIGFALRPIMILMLTKFIIPFYQSMLPQMQKLGDWVGRSIVPIIEGIFSFFTGVAEIIIGALTFNGSLIFNLKTLVVDGANASLLTLSAANMYKLSPTTLQSNERTYPE